MLGLIPMLHGMGTRLSSAVVCHLRSVRNQCDGVAVGWRETKRETANHIDLKQTLVKVM